MHARKSAPYVRNGDGAADDERDVEGVNNLVALPTFFVAAHQMISDAVVAAEHGGRDEAQQFLGLGTEGAGFVGLMIESKEALHAEVAAAENFLVQVGARLLKIFQAIAHGSSGESFRRSAKMPVGAIMNDLRVLRVRAARKHQGVY